MEPQDKQTPTPLENGRQSVSSFDTTTQAQGTERLPAQQPPEAETADLPGSTALPTVDTSEQPAPAPSPFNSKGEGQARAFEPRIAPDIEGTPPPTSVAPQPSAATKKQVASTQNTLQIVEIRDGLAIMRDGSLRAVIMCQSINFDLMSGGEREAVESSYQGFLNSLDFSIQIYIRSRRIDLNNYIDRLEKVHTKQENILLGLLMEDYIAYVRYLIQNSNIMDKQFYIVVPFYPTIIGKGISKGGATAGLRRLTSMLRPKQQTITINETEFNNYKEELTQRVQVVLNGLQQMNVQAVPLNTQELIELYYTVYNPQTAINERLTDLNDLEVPIVGKGTGEAPRVNTGDQP